MASKSTKKKSKGKGSSGGAQQFLIWHGEKIVVGIIGALALLFAVQGLGYFVQKAPVKPDVLIADSGKAEADIRKGTRTAKDEEIDVFEYDKYAEQIKQPISVEPYSTGAVWKPNIGPRQRSSSQL